MPRIRTIKPSFWKDQKIGKLKRDVRLMYIGMWNLADDEGIVNADPSIIKSELFPFDEDLRIVTVNEWIDQLQELRMIIPFTFNGESYYHVRNFKAHQNINRPQASKIPIDFIQGIINDDSLNNHGTVIAGREGKGKEWNGEGKEDRPQDLSNSNLYRKPTIPTIDQVRETFQRNGGSPEMADKFFLKHSATDWYLNGSPITRFASLVPSFIHNWNKNIKEPGKPKVHV